jgi:two-component sensor histidine kinase
MTAVRFARMSTGMKMLFILSAALLPLGLIAFLASLHSAKSNRSDREVEARLIAAGSARELTSAIARGTGALRGALDTINAAPFDAATCRRVFGIAARAQRWETHFALFDLNGRAICSTPGFSPLPATAPTAESGVDARVIESARTVRFDIVDRQARLVAAGELPERALAEIVRPPVTAGSYGIVIRQGDADIVITRAHRANPLTQLVTAANPVANGQLALELTINATPIRAIEVLMVLLPIVMWILAAVTGWFVFDRLLVRPLTQMQRAISDYRIGEGPLTLPQLMTPSQELRGLGEAFRNVTDRISKHDEELEQALARQTLLTREVHHRVKNNLQVVASLINLHSRSAVSEDAAAAYAAIQRRVDALSVVHRNHFAELEENRGVAMRALIGELASNLRATARPGSADLSISLDLVPAFASQDVAVPVAFLITEIVEMAMNCHAHPGEGITIRLETAEQPLKARLSIIAPALASDACRQHAMLGRFDRVIEGLSRQLRAKPIRNAETGSFVIEVPIAAPLDND